MKKVSKNHAKATIEYWACLGIDAVEGFEITDLVRELL